MALALPTFVERLFESLESYGIRYAVLRNWAELPFYLKSSDIDLAVHPEDSHKVESAIGAACMLSGVQLLGRARLREDFLRCFVVGTNTAHDAGGVSVDVFFGVYFKGGCEILPIDALLSNVETHNNVRVLREDVAILLAVIKESLHNLDIPSKYIDPFRLAFANDDCRSRSVFRLIDCHGWEHLQLAVDETDLSKRRRLLTRFRRSFLSRALMRSPLFVFRGFAFNYISLLARLVRPSGKVVAVLGVDGAGKSTNIAAIAPLLEAATHGAFVVRHLRPRLLPALAVLLKSPKANQVEETSPHSKPASSFVISIFRASYLLVDYIVGYWAIVRPAISKSPTVVLFDRYAYDLELDPRRYRINLPARIIRAFTWLAPCPDLIVCLHGDPQRVSMRKGELSFAEVTRQTDAIKAFARNHESAVLISTDRDVRESSLEMLNYICGAPSRGKS